MVRKSLWTLILAIGLAAPLTAQGAPARVPPPPKLEYDSLAFGRQLAQWYLYAEIDSLWAHSDSSLRAAFGGNKEVWAQSVAEFAAQFGQETAVIEERWVQRLGNRQYWRTMRLTDAAEPMALRWVLKPGKLTSGFGLNPVSDLPPVDPQ
jgi:hypothetical protein